MQLLNSGFVIPTTVVPPKDLKTILLHMSTQDIGLGVRFLLLDLII